MGENVSNRANNELNSFSSDPSLQFDLTPYFCLCLCFFLIQIGACCHSEVVGSTILEWNALQWYIIIFFRNMQWKQKRRWDEDGQNSGLFFVDKTTKHCYIVSNGAMFNSDKRENKSKVSFAQLIRLKNKQRVCICCLSKLSN